MKYQSIIINSNNYLNINLEDLKDDGSLWVITENTYNNGVCELNPYNLIDYYVSKSLFLTNIIIWVTTIDGENLTYKYIYTFSKSLNYYFTKDQIREKHKWAHLDWGKRKNKYNPLGKDPGNVWIQFIDDGKGNTIKHEVYNLSEIYERIILCSSKEQDNILIYHSDDLKFKENNRCINILKVIKNQNDNNKKIDNILEPTKKDIKPTFKVNYNSSEYMDDLENEIIDTVITSPPYWNLKNYGGVQSQIGYYEDYKEYHERLNNVWKECYRVLKNDGSIFINVNTLTKNKTIIPIHKHIIENMAKIGFIFKDMIIWAKPSGIPNTYSFSDRFEYVMWFVKDIDNFKLYNQKTNIGFIHEKYNKNSNIWLIHKKTGNNVKNLLHPAIYPNQLVNNCLNMTTENGDRVLDPFLGSGTTLIESIKLNRHFVGYEINNSYEDVIEYRIKNEI